MGQEYVLYDDDSCDQFSQMEQSSPVLVQQLLRQTRQLSPSDLRKYFDGLFQRMTIASKEAMTEIMWTGLNPSEQQAFEMPYFGHRWSENSIQTALSNAFVTNQVTTRELRVRRGRNLSLSDSMTHFSGGVSRGTTSRPPEMSPGISEAQELEEQFFSILRNAIVRAERNSPGTNMRVNVHTSSSGTNTNNTQEQF